MKCNIYLLLMATVYQIVILTACDTGWFGSSCQYKCHCVGNRCDGTGQCVAGTGCVVGWFGPLCQYLDLASSGATITPSNTRLADGNDTTCSNISSVEFSWTNAYQLNWFRIVLATPDNLDNLSIQMKTSISQLNISCSDFKKYKNSDTDIDVFCDTVSKATLIRFDFQSTKYVCSVYINGGRNVALKQTTWQSSTYTEPLGTYDSSRAVDGNTSGNFQQHSCTHTIFDGIPSTWKVFFTIPLVINRYVLYNRDSNQERLAGFSLRTMGRNGEVLFNYTDTTSNIAQYLYDVTSTNVIAASYTQISVNNYLTLCEVEIYGDNQCSNQTFGLECKSACNCMSGQENCLVATGGCASGCALGFYGEGCTRECQNHTYGSDCMYNCSSNCPNYECYKTNGHCFNCTAGYRGEFCNITCDKQHFGPNCVNNCSLNCENSECYATSGLCNRCKSGYQGEFCNKPCDDSHYGSNCINTCSPNCQEQKCDKVTGHCNTCIAGYLGGYCNITCPNQYYGAFCAQTCSKNCQNLECNSAHGACYSCSAGYRGDFCNMSCDTNHYGPNCVNNCSSTCVGSSCDATTGHCYSCIQGYRGQFCQEAHDRLAEGVGIGIGTMCAVIVIVLAVVCIVRRTAFSATSNVNSRDEQTENRNDRENSQPVYNEMDAVPAAVDPNAYDYIGKYTGPYDTLNKEGNEKSQYEAVSMTTINT